MSIDGIAAQNRANTAQTRAKNKALEEQKNNYNKKQNCIMEAKDKAIDNSRSNTHAAGRETAKNINSTFEEAKFDTTRKMDYSKASGGEIVGDLAKRSAGKVANAGIEGGRQAAKAGYNYVLKPMAKGATAVAAGTKKAVNHVTGTAKKVANAVSTKTEQCWNSVKATGQNIGNIASRGWNALCKLGSSI